MSLEPKVSIITISFNAEKYIERTIKSVVAQTYSNLEYIIVDGSSKDNTTNIIKKYDTMISSWISEPDKNLFDAMNKGLEMATGDYVLFMNSGDCIQSNNSLENLMKNAQNADLIYSKAEYIDKNGNRRVWHKITPTPSKLNVRSFLNGMVVCHQCMIVKKTISPYYRIEPWKISNDIDWAIRVMKNVKKVHFIDDTFCLYLEGGISKNNRVKAAMERFNILVLHFGWVPTIIQQVKIILQLIRKGRISY